MPVFISYSHHDKEFVDQLAGQLVRNNVHVWLDRWELSVGDSIIDRVQEAVEGSSALLVIMSKASVTSEWCKKELSAGFLRELEEKRVVVLPVLLEDCDIPIFARGKLYADFRTNFDDGLTAVSEGIAKVVSASLGRFSEPTYHTDWSIDWGEFEGGRVIVLNYVQFAQESPNTCLTNIEILASPVASKIFDVTKDKYHPDIAKLHVIGLLSDYLNQNEDFKIILSNEREIVQFHDFDGPAFGESYRFRMGVRRLGMDTGKNLLVNVGGVVAETFQHMGQVLRKPTS